MAVSDSDIMTTAVVLGLVILFVVVFYKELLVTSFDATYAKTYGLNVQVVHYALMLVLTLVTVSALQTVGIILVVAMLITPAATAFLWTDKLATMLILSAAVGVVSSMTGLFFSYTFNWASGPAIVIVAAGLFALSFIFSPKQNFFKLQRSVAQ
ncbi:iron ABC transporter membrane protein [Companilactobacillus versmoldensis DSM 14857 = KCTC 3814]|uniref:Iron ABC transporter membrane protein n=1 Tax=Companilactobacillus versmoldensis DSM 14857 = KCTC 3814 TaxID=1423815 RepID=A0A0R1SH50_9LACO|nr:iron ABC transporter membrane protein [Companilactobacillus versmoldensis DSM 14857 = KCTC 3814]